MNTYLIIAGALVILALAIYAGYLHWLLRRQRRRQAAARTSAAGVHTVDPGAGRPDSERVVASGKGIYLVAEAILDDKLTHTEGCLRICAMAGSLPDHKDFREQYPVFYRVAEATAHIPILDDWHALDDDTQRRLDKERRAVEAEHGGDIIQAARHLKERYLSAWQQ